MGIKENRSNEQRVWKNRLDEICQRYNIIDKEEFKRSREGEQLKNSSNPWSRKNKLKHIKYKNEIKRDRQKTLNDIYKEVVDNSYNDELTSLRNELNEINSLITRYDELLLELNDKKYELEKKISFIETYE